jgi:RNA polymerase primary sigma factor
MSRAMKDYEYQFEPASGEYVEAESDHNVEQATSDTISVYLKSLHHTSLLSRSEEVRVVREMERYERRAQRMLSRSLPAVAKVLEFAQTLHQEGLRLSDLMIFPRGEADDNLGDGVEHCEAPPKPDDDLRQEEVLYEKLAALQDSYEAVRRAQFVAQTGGRPTKPDYQILRLRVRMGQLLIKLPFNKLMRHRLERAWSGAVDDALDLRGEAAKIENRIKNGKLDESAIRLAKRQLRAVRQQMESLEEKHAVGVQELIASWKRFADAKQKSESFKARMIESNLKLVVFIGRDFMGRGLAMEDLIQEGNIGLIRAVEKFDWRRGIKFSTYAVWWIKQAIQLAIANQSRTIRLPTYMVDRVNRVRRVLRQMSARVDAEPTPEEIAPLVGLTPDDVRQVLNVVNEPVSLETPTTEDDGEHSLGDLLPDHQANDPLQDSMTLEMAKNLREALSKLSFRESEVLTLRFGLGGDGREWTLEEIGQRFSLTRERIRQIEMRALAKLSHPSRSRKLRDMSF